MTKAFQITKFDTGIPDALGIYDAAMDKLSAALEEFDRETKDLFVTEDYKTIPTIPVLNASRNEISNDVIEILRAAHCEGFQLYLPDQQLDKKLYARVNEILERLGGKWKGGKIRAHVFEEEPAPLLENILVGKIKPPDNPLDFYETPDEIIDQMLALLTLTEPRSFLESSAGNGAILRKLIAKFPRAVAHACEIDPKRIKRLQEISVTCRLELHERDFLEHQALYDLIVMNPPFTATRNKFEYTAHIKHAWGLLQPKGELVSVAPAGLLTSDIKQIRALRDLAKGHGKIVRLPENAFKESDTSVKTVLLYLKKGS